MPTPVLHPRLTTEKCVSCRKPFARGDRVQVVHIVVDTGKNPTMSNIPGAWLSEEFELAHISCVDPALNGFIIGK